MHHQWRRDGLTVSTDPARLDIDMLYAFLSTCYWAQGIPRAVCVRSIIKTESFSEYEGPRQVGFARVVTDYATVGYMGDVFILEPWRGRGLSRFLMDSIMAHPELQGFRRWMLLTHDAHGPYSRYGFTELNAPERWMEKWVKDVYGVGR